ncbi:hypothetical protein QG37_08347 [Candidozyma auris]|uniref:Uncharacterized protein n=1 Tax=Candidozyma auris TaxID=498019 RepID=A0A0L0NMR0_CANAR|nr:hypothetical protein QG37_08347 [[Candida] auris]
MAAKFFRAVEKEVRWRKRGVEEMRVGLWE